MSTPSNPVMESLAEKLKNFKTSFEDSAPAEILETINRSISLFQNPDVTQSSPDIGADFPVFSLTDICGNLTDSTQLCASSPLIITFIRGGWCPYCMLEMQSWQQRYEAANEQLNIVAITPELPELSQQVQSDNNIAFPILVDKCQKLIERAGLIWQLDDDMQALLLKWNIDLTQRTAMSNYSLPVPATFVIDKQHKVRYRFIEEDYTLRAEPEQVLRVYHQYN